MILFCLLPLNLLVPVRIIMVATVTFNIVGVGLILDVEFYLVLLVCFHSYIYKVTHLCDRDLVDV